MSVADQFADTGDAEIIEPLPIIAAVTDPEDFPVGELGSILGGAVNAIARRVRVPAAMAAQSVLSAVSLAIQPLVDVRLPFGDKRPTSLFMLTIADSSDRKSTSDDQAMVEPRKFQQELNEAYSSEAAQHANEVEAWKASRADVKSKNKGSSLETLRAALDELGPQPEAPWSPIVLSSAPTTQYLIRAFAITRPSLGLMSDEGGKWIGGFGMGEEQRLFTIATLSNLWDGKPVMRETAGEGGHLMYGRRLTFHMMVQPSVARLLLGDGQSRDQGFLNRVLVAAPKSLAGSRIHDPAYVEPPEIVNALSRFHDRLGKALRSNLPYDKEKDILEPKVIAFDDEGERLWWTFSNHLESKIGRRGELEDIKGFAGKLPEIAARIAALIHVFENGINSQVIAAVTLARAIEIAKFYLGETKRLASMAAPDQLILDAVKLSDWLEGVWTEPLISTTDIVQKVTPHTLRRGTDYAKAMLEVLERHFHVVKRNKAGIVAGKKRRETWRVIVGRQSQAAPAAEAA